MVLNYKIKYISIIIAFKNNFKSVDFLNTFEDKSYNKT